MMHVGECVATALCRHAVAAPRPNEAATYGNARVGHSHLQRDQALTN